MSALTTKAAEYAPMIRQAAARYLVDPTLLAGLVAQESGFNPRAFNPEGAGSTEDDSRGLVQMSWRTARALGYQGTTEGLFNPATSLEYGAKLLADNRRVAQAAAPLVAQREIEDRALSAYNAGFSTVRRGDAKRDSAGRFINQAYVDSVRRFQGLLGPTVLAPGASPGTPATQPPAPQLEPSGSSGAVPLPLILAGLGLAGIAFLLAGDRQRDRTAPQF